MTIKINDITWTFDLVKGTDSNLLFDNEFVYGITCYNDMHVYVSKDLPIELRKRTLTHEMVHAVLFSHMLRKYESFTEEEMADFVAKYFDTICILRDTIMNEWKSDPVIAQDIYNQGYRKASDVIDEFVERLKEENEMSFRRYGKGIGISTIFRIADEMRQEVEK